MRRRILLVEDHVDFREMLAEWLGRRGYDVACAGTADEALELARACPFDVVVLDLLLPGASGLEVQAALLADQPDLAVIVLSGEATVEAAVATLREGRAFDFLIKPLVDPGRLQAAIERALAHRPPRVESALAPRERDILQLLSAGLSNAAIADRLGLSERTVRNRLTLLYTKLGVETRTQALLAYRPR
ncbi:MAG: two component, sigma54 specific, transcriptional regulator, Fis family [Cyanobacteria bacterium RYN_339]|nr:two component, sigma54 specific, transcriptional regulator, Fis family [Cyanobacteria bacterium RYN_339]